MRRSPGAEKLADWDGLYTLDDQRLQPVSQGSEARSQEATDILDLDTQELVHYIPVTETPPNGQNESSVYPIPPNGIVDHQHQPQLPLLDSLRAIPTQQINLVQPTFQEQHQNVSIAEPQPGPSHQHLFTYGPPLTPFNGTNHNQLMIAFYNTNINPRHYHQPYSAVENYFSPMPMIAPFLAPQRPPATLSPPEPVAGQSQEPQRAGPSRLIFSHPSSAMNPQPLEPQSGLTASTPGRSGTKTHFCDVCKTSDGGPKGFTSIAHMKRHTATKIHENALKAKNLWTPEMEASKQRMEASEAEPEHKKKSAKNASNTKATDQNIEKATKWKKNVAKKSEEASTSKGSPYPILSHPLSQNFTVDTNSPPQTEFIPQPGPSSQMPPIIPTHSFNLPPGYSQTNMPSDPSRSLPFSTLLTSLQTPQLHHVQNLATTSSPMAHHQLQAQIAQNNYQQVPPAYPPQDQLNSTSSSENPIGMMTMDENGQNNSNPTEDEEIWDVD